MTNKRYHHEYKQEQVSGKALDKDLIFRFWGYLKPYRLWLLLAVLFLCISKVIEAVIPLILGDITQQFLVSFNDSPEVKEQTFDQIFFVLMLIMGAFLLSYLLDAGNVFLKSWIGQKALFKLRMDVYEHIQKMGMPFFDQHRVGRLMSRTIHDVEQINQMFAESLVPIFGNIVLFVGILIGIVWMDWRLGFIILIIGPPTWWLTNSFRNKQRICYNRVRAIMSAMNAFVQEHLMGAFTIRSFGLEKKEKANLEKINDDHCEANIEIIYNFAFFIAAIDFLQSLSLILVFILLIHYSPIGGDFQAGKFFTFSLYTLMIFRPLLDLAERYNVLQSAMASGERIFEVIDQKTEPLNIDSEESFEEIETIEFDDVWFAYKEPDWILRGVSFKVNQGESVALVGITGAGKSSIISLILRFYDYQKGSIKINGKDIRTFDLEMLRRQFALLLQDPVIYSGSIKENITLFDPSISQSKVDDVISYLNMRPFLERFPGGLQYQLTERGKSLSAGEMQLISMARALVHHRQMICLDEATANIDVLTEQVIQAALQKILAEKTAVVVAHRLSTIKDADRIIVLHQGTVAETGTHNELLALKGIYEKFYRLQFS